MQEINLGIYISRALHLKKAHVNQTYNKTTLWHLLFIIIIVVVEFARKASHNDGLNYNMTLTWHKYTYTAYVTRYLPGWGQWVIIKVHGLGKWLPLHFGWVLA